MFRHPYSMQLLAAPPSHQGPPNAVHPTLCPPHLFISLDINIHLWHISVLDQDIQHPISRPERFLYLRNRFPSEGTFLPFISLVLFDSVAVYITLVGLISATPEQKWYERIKNLVGTEYMGHTSRVFLRTGQAYYVQESPLLYDQTNSPTNKLSNLPFRATIGMHLTLVISCLFPGMPSYSACQLALLSCTYHSIITCRVYRLLKVETLGRRGWVSSLSESSSDFPSFMTSLVFNDPQSLVTTVLCVRLKKPSVSFQLTCPSRFLCCRLCGRPCNISFVIEYQCF